MMFTLDFHLRITLRGEVGPNNCISFFSSPAYACHTA